MLGQSQIIVRMKSKRKKDAGTRKKSVKKYWGLVGVGEEEDDLVDVPHGFEEGAKKRNRKGLKEREGIIKKRKRISIGGKEDIVLLAKHQSTTNNEKEKKNRKVKEMNLPVLVLERVFSYLDWKDLGTVMLVCQRWSYVGGHPSLWTGFPLLLAGPRLDSFSKIRRLSWIKSVTITLLPGRELENCDAIVNHFTRMEELFVNDGGEGGVDISEDFFGMILGAQVANNRLVVGVKMSEDILDAQLESHIYFVTSCDAGTNAFVKKTYKENYQYRYQHITISGLPGVQMSYEILEAICWNKTSPLMFRTNLIIGQNMDVLKLTEFLKHHVRLWDIGIMMEKDLESQEVAPINAILDLLGSGNHGAFLLLGLPIELLLKSHWVERLGGRGKVEAHEDKNGAVRVRPKYPNGSISGLTFWKGEAEGNEDDSEDSDDD